MSANPLPSPAQTTFIDAPRTPQKNRHEFKNLVQKYGAIGLNLMANGGYLTSTKRHKEPFHKMEWGHLKTYKQSISEMLDNYEWEHPDCTGLSVITGVTSEWLAICDIDLNGTDPKAVEREVRELITALGITPYDSNRWMWRGFGWAVAIVCEGLKLSQHKFMLPSGAMLEIIHDGQYQVLAGSIHPSGKLYRSVFPAPVGGLNTKQLPDKVNIDALINAIGKLTGCYPEQVTDQPQTKPNTAPIQSTDATKDAIIAALGISGQRPNAKGFIACRCPFPDNHHNDDIHPSAALNVDNEYFLTCRGCERDYNTRELCEQLGIAYKSQTNSHGLSINHLNAIAQRHGANIARVYAILHTQYHDGSQFTAHDVLEGNLNIKRNAWAKFTKTDLLTNGDKIPTPGRSLQIYRLTTTDQLTDQLGINTDVYRAIPDAALTNDKYFSAWLVLAPIYANGEKTIAQSLLAQNSGVTDRTVRNYLHDTDLQIMLFGATLEVIHNYDMSALSVYDIKELPDQLPTKEKCLQWVIPIEQPDQCPDKWKFPATRGAALRCYMAHGAAWLVRSRMENTYRVVSQ